MRTKNKSPLTLTPLPDGREGDRDDAHAQQLNAGPDQHTEKHRELRRRPENVGVHELQGAGKQRKNKRALLVQTQN